MVAPKWLNDIRSAADNAIFKYWVQNIECSFGCVARSAVLLKLNVSSIFVKKNPFNSITIAIDCNGLSLLIFEEK